MLDALKTFLDSVAAGDDTRTEEAALVLGQRSAENVSAEGSEAARQSLGDAMPPSLRDLLADADPDHRWWAARALAAVGTQAAQDLLITAPADPDPDVRACAALNDPSGIVTHYAEEALERMGVGLVLLRP